MEQQVYTNRKLQKKNSFAIIEQRCCQTLLFKLMKYQAILYAIMTVLSFPMWVLPSLEFSKYQANYKGIPSVLDYFLVVTNAHQHHCQGQTLSTYYLAEQSNYECILAKQQKNTTLTYLSISGTKTASIKPNISSVVAEKDKNSKKDQKSKGNNISISNNMNTGNQNNQTNKNTNNKKQKDYHDNRDGNHSGSIIIHYQHPYFRFSLIYDSILQFLLCIGCAIIQYRSFRVKQVQKGNFIQNYSLQLYNLPIQQPYMLLPKLQAYIIKQINKGFNIVTQNQQQPQIFSTTSAIAEQEFNQLTLNSEIKLRVSQGIQYTNLQQNKSKVLDEVQKKIQKINDKLTKFSHSSAQSDTVWVTFQTRKARYLALRSILSAKQKFMNHRIKVKRSAPHPLQIIWQNLHIRLSTIILSKVIIITICMAILLAIDLLILYIQKTTYLLVATIAIFIIQVILKQIIVNISKYGKYRLKSKQDLSIFCNLIKFLYINTALITFMSSYDFGDFWVVHTFSTCMYQGIGYKWFENVGKSILLNFFIQMVYVCVRPFIQVIKMRVFTRISILIQKIKKRFSKRDIELMMYGQKKQISQKQKLKSELDICYAYLICVLMFGNTYTFTHPIIYFLLTFFFIVVSISHKKYIVEYAEPAPYNTNLLNHKAIQYMYYSVVAHWIFIYVVYKFLFALVLAAALTIILIFKNTLIEFILEKLRIKNGPFSSTQFNRIFSQKMHLSELLTMEQIKEQIQILQNKIIQYTYLYTEKNASEDGQKRQQLANYITKLEQKICKLEKCKQLRSCEQKNCEIEGIQGDYRKIKGALSYNFTQQLYNM